MTKGAENVIGEWCVVDVETTGLYPDMNDRVLEIALVLVDRMGGTMDEWHSLVNPDRDLGPTSIHQITSELTNQAPSFPELAGDILKFMNGRRLVAHNASFDGRFLKKEFERAGIDLGRLDALCTMQIASGLGIGRALAVCCSATGIENTAPHMALGDARATAELLSYFLKLRHRGEAWPERVRIPSPIAVTCSIQPSGRALTRNVAAERATPESYLSRLAGRLPTPTSPAGTSEEAVTNYAEILDRVLEDRVVTKDELTELASFAHEWGLGREQLAEINLSYMRGIVSIALADGVVTLAERHDLECAAALLGVDPKMLDSLLENDAPAGSLVLPGDGCEFEGKTVCFSGASNCTVNGEQLTRGVATEVATAAGLTVSASVTKHLDVLVVADAATQSGKAKKARRYGTRIIAERSFWPRVGVSID